MKRKKILKLFSIALVLSLLVLAVPAAPALGVNDVTISPISGKINDAVFVTGNNFTAFLPDGTYEYWANVYFSKDNAVKNTAFATNVHTYNWVDYVPIYDNGSGVGVFDSAFSIPTSLTEGSVDAAVTPGTYYVYVTVTKVTIATSAEVPQPNIYGKSPAFTITASATLDPLSPATGGAGTDIIVSGANFPASTALVFRFDTTTLIPKSGHTATTSGGLFLSTITVPPTATAGAHTITVTAGTGSVTATFTVTASATLNPLSIASGPAGIQIPISGTNFPAGTIAITFDSTPLTVTGSTQTSGGSFASFVTIPASATAAVHTITVTVGAASVQTNFTVTASATAVLNPLDPASGPAGTQVALGGANFPTGLITVTLDGAQLILAGSLQTTGGSFLSLITIPAGTASGEHTISVTVGTVTISDTFTVTGAPTPTSTPTPTPTTAVNVGQSAFDVGSPISIGGTGFAAGSTVTIKYGGVTRATAPVDSNGTFQVIFEIPEIQPGAHQFTISDGLNTTAANFVVETTAPAVPSILAPEPGFKINIPVTFDWDNVTDDSLPVTYDFQIATDEDFTAGSIILEKNGLTESEFMLTEAEGLELASDNASYFWRVKSVDGALNESAWTAVSDFSSGGPSTFPRWALILIIVFGAIFVFGLGYWIGRRTAYYY